MWMRIGVEVGNLFDLVKTNGAMDDEDRSEGRRSMSLDSLLIDWLGKRKRWSSTVHWDMSCNTYIRIYHSHMQ
jgi:hypothetical protein